LAERMTGMTLKSLAWGGVVANEPVPLKYPIPISMANVGRKKCPKAISPSNPVLVLASKVLETLILPRSKVALGE